jgi:hypothetical protein
MRKRMNGGIIFTAKKRVAWDPSINAGVDERHNNYIAARKERHPSSPLSPVVIAEKAFVKDYKRTASSLFLVQDWSKSVQKWILEQGMQATTAVDIGKASMEASNVFGHLEDITEVR